MSIEALTHYLTPLLPWLNDPQVSEIMVNDPCRIFIDKAGSITEQALPTLTFEWSEGLARLMASFTQQRLSEKEPLLSAILPTGERAQIVLPPACEAGKIIFSFRKQVVRPLTLEDYEKNGSFAHTQRAGVNTLSADEKALATLFEAQQWSAFLTEAIRRKKNILISGATHSGKTAFLNACLRLIPAHERIITLEDTREIKIPHANQVNLIASKNNQGVSLVTMSQLVATSLRLRPDRMIVGEVRSEEALDFVNAAKTGHDGTLASIHASSPRIAFLRLSDLIQSNPATQLSRQDILADLYSLMDVVVQLKRSDTGAPYQISEIYSSFNQKVNDVKNAVAV